MSWYWPGFVIPTTLASSSDYETWTGTTAPTNIDQILRSCTSLVLDASAGAYYTVDPTTGLATDTTTANALRDATCIQAAAWVQLGIDPLAGGVISKSGAVASKKIGSGQVVYDNSGSAIAAQSRADAAIGLVPDAERMLRQNNLWGFHPWVLG